VTRLSEFSPIGRSLDILWNLQKSIQHQYQLFPRLRLCIDLNMCEMDWATFWAIFSKTHPVTLIRRQKWQKSKLVLTVFPLCKEFTFFVILHHGVCSNDVHSNDASSNDVCSNNACSNDVVLMTFVLTKACSTEGLFYQMLVLPKACSNDVCSNDIFLAALVQTSFVPSIFILTALVINILLCTTLMLQKII
jgi:hypothetical protein